VIGEIRSESLNLSRCPPPEFEGQSPAHSRPSGVVSSGQPGIDSVTEESSARQIKVGASYTSFVTLRYASFAIVSFPDPRARLGANELTPFPPIRRSQSGPHLARRQLVVRRGRGQPEVDVEERALPACTVLGSAGACGSFPQGSAVIGVEFSSPARKKQKMKESTHGAAITFRQLTPSSDAEQVLVALWTAISDDNLSWEAVLQQIVRAAHISTGANGAAIALLRGDFVICQARSGDMAPDLGIKLEAGLSEQCLRTGEALRCDDSNVDMRVDANVCRRLGLRSLAVVPVGKQPAVLGVLEVFSELPYAFRDFHLEFLGELAEVVFAAQARPQTVQATHEKLRTRPRWSKRTLIPAVAIALGLLGWLGFRRKPSQSSTPTPPSVAGTSTLPMAAAPDAEMSNSDRLPALPPPETKRSQPLVLASKTENARPTEATTGRKAVPKAASNLNSAVNAPPTPVAPPPQIPANMGTTLPALSATSRNALGALSAAHELPQVTIRVSQGTSGGTIERQVQPIYPPEARALKLEGSVLLHAVVLEDGTVHDMKVISGDPVLARAAMKAVAQWRYQPYRLNGNPIPMQTEITLVFKLP
jgi:TonB family protein